MHDVCSEWLWSEKLDGVRGHWDGKNMYTRSGMKIDIPDRVKEELPKVALDGEIWKERGNFRASMQAIYANKNSEKWDGVDFYVFDYRRFDTPFHERYDFIQRNCPHYCKQHKITSEVPAIFWDIVDRNGEGMIFRDPEKCYKIGRVRHVVKCKPIYEGYAKNIDSDTYQDLHTQAIFKIRSNEPYIHYIYNGHTKNGLPKYPRLKKSK